MRQLLLTCVAAGAFSLASAAAKADVVVYNGGAPNLASAFVADSDASIAVYISFVLPAGVSSITDAEWWGGCYPATTCGAINPPFTTSVLSNTSSGPGAVIATHDVGGADQTATGRSISGLFAEYVYNASLPAISLTPKPRTGLKSRGPRDSRCSLSRRRQTRRPAPKPIKVCAAASRPCSTESSLSNSPIRFPSPRPGRCCSLASPPSAISPADGDMGARKRLPRSTLRSSESHSD